jgi:hypothetical protein
MARAARVPAVDLFAWRAVADARAALEAAEADREEAARRYHHAPHGHLRDRYEGFQEATHRVLRAVNALASAIAEAEQ